VDVNKDAKCIISFECTKKLDDNFRILANKTDRSKSWHLREAMKVYLSTMKKQVN
jgi:predicted transcriptional regulator